ncbi:MAG: hypothetical protein AAF645_24125 [Myxococcota bacterium]
MRQAKGAVLTAAYLRGELPPRAYAERVAEVLPPRFSGVRGRETWETWIAVVSQLAVPANRLANARLLGRIDAALARAHDAYVADHIRPASELAEASMAYLTPCRAGSLRPSETRDLIDRAEAHRPGTIRKGFLRLLAHLGGGFRVPCAELMASEMLMDEEEAAEAAARSVRVCLQASRTLLTEYRALLPKRTEEYLFCGGGRH